MKKHYQIFLLTLITSLLISCSEKPVVYLYYDGNNNLYGLNSDKKLIYDPVTPEMSSSGAYSGGIPKEVMLNDVEYKKLTTLITSIYKNKKNHTTGRNMGTGMIKLVFAEDKNQIAFINNNSEEKNQLEKYLIELFLK